MIKREQTFTTTFQRWLKYRWTNGNAYFEIKVSRTDSLPFSVVKDHQISNLQLKRIIHKFSDELRLTTLFDVILCEGKGYVVIQYYRPRNKEFFIIPIDTFIKEKASSTRKSLTESRCREIGTSYHLA